MGTNPSSTPVLASDGFHYGTTIQGSRNKSGVVYRVNADGSEYRVIYHFGVLPPPGISSANRPVYPAGRLLEASDGRLYGVARNAASPFGGAIFRLEKSGAGFRLLREFPTSGSQPTSPEAGLIQGTDGLLYGTTTDSGPGAPTTIFRMNMEGGAYQVIYTMGQLAASPRSVFNPLWESSDGLLYGTSRTGGATNNGAVFRLAKTGTGFQVIHSFSSADGGGYSPWGGVIEGSDGLLYGTVEYGGSRGGGGIYRLGRDGMGFGMVCQLSNVGDGELRRPRAEVVESPDGYLYGVASESFRASFGDPTASGGLFRVRKDASGFEVLARFASMGQGTETPETGMVLTSTGALLGVANPWGSNFLPGFLYGLDAQGGSFSVLRRFSGSGGDPRTPWSIIEGTDNRFYGATNRSDFDDDFFSLQRDGRDVRVLYQFKGDTRSDKPVSGELFEGADRRFYASSYLGGVGQRGSMTRIDADGTNFTRLHSLNTAPATAPKDPFGGVIQGRDGFFYGTTSQGGRFERGTVFRMAADGTGWTVIHDFIQDPGHFSANSPLHQLLEGRDGALHGVTRFGCYRLNKDGTGFLFTDFPRTGAEPPLPRGPLMEASDGVLYGTTNQGGAAGLGTIFRINPDGSGFMVLHQCTSAGGAPYRPVGRLAEGLDGKIYGVTANGGTNSDHGALYSLNRNGNGFTRLRSFGATGDGINPLTLVRSGDGLFYGITQRGGAFDFGTFFRYGEAPEISVEQPAGTDLASGSSRLEFGEVRLGMAQTLDLVVRNTGELPLGPVVAAIDGPQESEFAAVALVPDTIAPGASGVLKISLSPGGLGLRSAMLRIGSNDFDESPFVVALSGTGVAPDIAVHEGPSAASPELTDGQTTPVNFGVVRVVGQAERRFFITNTGNAPLTISSITVPAGFTVQPPAGFPAILAAGGELGIGFLFEARTPGLFSGILSIVSDDPDESSFDFPVSGEAVSPEIMVHRGPDTTAPELTSGQTEALDFGRVVQGTVDAEAVKVLTVANAGTAPLAVTAIAVPPGYELSAPAVATIAPGTSVSWEIRLTSLAVGPHAGSVIISSDDLDEAQFSFPVAGEIFIPDPAVTVADAETALNRQSGLREQSIRIANDTQATVPAYRLLISGLPVGVTVANATGVLADGTVVVLVRQSLQPFSSFDLVLEYASANRQPVRITPVIATEVVLDPPPAGVGAVEGAFEIDRVVWLPDGNGLLLEFNSLPGKRYAVEYSDDGTAWKSSPTAVRAPGNRTQWFDRGPPSTVSPPGVPTVRLYRVRALAD